MFFWGFIVPKKDRKYFEFVRAIAIVALVLTIVLWVGLWGASAIDGERSEQSTVGVTQKLNDKFGLDQQIGKKVSTQSMYFAHTDIIRFAGVQEKVPIIFSPQNTIDKDVEYAISDNSYADVDQDGVITFKEWGWGAMLRATLKSNPEVYCEIAVGCRGLNPEEVDQNVMEISSDIKVGTSKKVSVNGGQTSPLAAKRYVSSDTSVAQVEDGKVFGVGAGQATITAYFDEDISASCVVTVKNNPDFTPPADVSLNDVVPELEIYSVHDGNTFIEGSLNDFCVVSDNPSVLKVYDGSLHAEALGTANVTYSSRYNPDVKKTLTVTVLPPHIDKIEIFGNDTVSPNSHFKYICGESDFVVWEVVSGKAEISKSGYLVAKTFGDVTIRCSSMADPSVYAEKTVSVALFSSSYEFVRKLMGHAGLSALLGFGLFGTTFLLFRRKWASLPSSVALSLVYALVSEFIQYFTPGRYCTLSDVLVDFLGALVGIAVAIGVVAVVTTVWYVANKKSAKSLVHAIRLLNFSTAFKKVRVQEEYVREAVRKEENSPANPVFTDDALGLAASDKE